MASATAITRVLVVGADRITVDALAALLKARGYKARAAYSLSGALTTATDLKPHVLISSLDMQGDGIELAEEFAKRFPDSKLVLMSSSASIPLADELTLRVDAFIHKDGQLQQILEFLAAQVAVG